MDLDDGRAGRVGADQDAGQDVADQGRLAEPVGHEAPQEGRDHDQDEVRDDTHASARRSAGGRSGTRSSASGG